MKSKAAAVVVWLLLAGAARAQSSPVENKAEARQHFEGGLLNVGHGDLAGALREFQLAYELRPHFSVLYNIGQAYVALGKPVEAVAAFERYLAEGGEQIEPARRAAVQNLLESNRGRVGYLRLSVPEGPQTDVWLDGVAVPPEQLQTPIAVATGEHGILHFREGCAPASQKVVVPAIAVLEVTLPGAEGCRQQGEGTASALNPGAVASPRLSAKARLRSPSLLRLPARGEATPGAKQRRNAYVLGGVGFGVLGTAAGLYAWNTRRYDTWNGQSSMAGFAERLNRASAVQRMDDLSMGLAIVGTGTVLGAVWLLLTASSSK